MLTRLKLDGKESLMTNATTEQYDHLTKMTGAL